MSRRRYLIAVSILGHLGIGVGLFASGIWELERLSSDSRLAGIGVMTFAQAGGSPADLPEPKLQKKKKPEVEKKIVKDVQWDKRVEKKVEAPKEEVAEIGGTGNGLGTGTGDETGESVGPGNGTPCPPTEHCVGGIPVPKPPEPPKPKTTQLVRPDIMNALRISGDTQIHPTRATKNEIVADGKKRVAGTLKVCIGASGAISSVDVLSSTKYPEYDQRLVEAARRWRYRPYTIDGVAHPACSPVTFVYTIE